MGSNMARRLVEGGHQVVAWDRDAGAVAKVASAGATGASSRADLAQPLKPARGVGIMVPAGDATEATVTALADVLEKGDTIIDGGTSYYKDDVRRAAMLVSRGIHYVDVGTSGGIWGAERGYCLMIGGE